MVRTDPRGLSFDQGNVGTGHGLAPVPQHNPNIPSTQPPSEPSYLQKCGIPVALFLLALVFGFIGIWVEMSLITELAFNVDTSWGPAIYSLGTGHGDIAGLFGLIFDIAWWVFWHVIVERLGWFEKLGAIVRFGDKMTPWGFIVEMAGLTIGIVTGMMSLANEGCI